MRKCVWTAVIALPLAVIGGLVYANSVTQNTPQASQEDGYTCPITGEQLPCPKCCPLNQQ